MREPRRVWALSERCLVLCPRLSLSLPCFLRVLMILYMDKTLDEEYVLMIYWWFGGTELTFVNLVFGKTTSPQHFFVEERPTTSFPPALHEADNYTHAGHDQANKLVLFFLLGLGFKVLWQVQKTIINIDCIVPLNLIFFFLENSTLRALLYFVLLLLFPVLLFFFAILRFFLFYAINELLFAVWNITRGFPNHEINIGYSFQDDVAEN